MNDINHSSLSGLIDIRDAAVRTIEDGKVKVVQRFPNIDYLYGPYYAEGTEGEEGYKSAKQVAFEKLKELSKMGNDGLILMKTVGVVEDGVGREYWFREKCETIDDLVPKGSGYGSGDSSLITVNYEYEQLRIKDPDDDTLDKYFVPLLALEVKKATISSINRQSVIEDVTFVIDYDTASKLYVSFDDNEHYELNTDGLFTIVTGYTDDVRNTKITKLVYFKCEKYGVEVESTVTITIVPKINLKDIEIEGSKYDDTRNIKFYKSTSSVGYTTYTTPSETKEITDDYVEVTVEPQYDSDSRPVPTTIGAGKYSVKGTDNDTSAETPYVDTEYSNSSFIVGAMPTYYGFSTADSFNSRAEIESGGLTRLTLDTITNQQFNNIVHNDNMYFFICTAEKISNTNVLSVLGNPTRRCTISELSQTFLSDYHIYRSADRQSSDFDSFYIEKI